MPEETIIQNAETQVETAQSAETETVDVEQFDPARAKALIDKLRGEIKELKPKAKLADDLSTAEQKRKEAEMTELQKLEAKLKETEKALKEKTKNEMRLAAANKVGLPVAFADRLKGETPEDLEADAKTLLEALPKAPKTPTVNPTNPGLGAGVGETYEQKRARIYGINANPYDVAAMRQQGGGVYWSEKE